MELEADVLELHGDRVPTRPYDLATLRRRLEAERKATPSHERQIWYVGIQGRSVGPLTAAGLEGLAARGQLGRDSLVWRDGWPAWTAAGAVPELRAILGLPAASPAADPPALPEGPP
jgi:GYF domain 2